MPRTIDLLALVDPSKDAVSGNWTLGDEGLSGEAGNRIRIELPYEPPREYDFHVVFARTAGNWVVDQLCKLGESDFAWETGYEHDTGFAYAILDGPGTVDRHLIYPNAPLINDRRYDSLVSVRRDRVQAFLDGKLIGEFDPAQYQAHIDDGFLLQRRKRLGVSAHESSVTFYSIDVTEIGGRGAIDP